MNGHNTIVHLPTVAVPLASGPHRLGAALGCARLVHAPDGFGVRMVSGNDLLASISELLFIPLDQFEEAL
jgi:hypothetical protein